MKNAKEIDKQIANISYLMMEDFKERKDNSKFIESVLSHYNKKKTLTPKQLAACLEIYRKNLAEKTEQMELPWE